MLDLLLVLKLIACTPVQPLGIRFFSIPSTSMEPTLRLGSMVAVDRCSYGLSRYSYDAVQLPLRGRFPPRLPVRGDVVVFRVPADRSTFYIKRVIGLPGDRIELRDGRILLNGAPVPRRTIDEKTFVETLPDGGTYTIVLSGGIDAPNRTTVPVEVPANEVYVLGDNRDNSLDSRVGANPRWSAGGTIPVEFLFGRVEGVGYWPLDALWPLGHLLMAKPKQR